MKRHSESSSMLIQCQSLYLHTWPLNNSTLFSVSSLNFSEKARILTVSDHSNRLLPLVTISKQSKKLSNNFSFEFVKLNGRPNGLFIRQSSVEDSKLENKFIVPKSFEWSADPWSIGDHKDRYLDNLRIRKFQNFLPRGIWSASSLGSINSRASAANTLPPGTQR